MAENETPTTQDAPELEERWIFGDGEGMQAAEYVVHLGKPGFVAQIIELEDEEEDGFDLEFVRWFDPAPTEEAELDRLRHLAAEAIAQHDEDMERLDQLLSEEDEEAEA